jgi:4-alpha-glucanotransferase
MYAKERGRAAGLRVGLYLDLAVGVAPDGSATWSDRAAVIPSARIGAPPDYFNASGQDWGLAPRSPAALAARDLAPFREALDVVARYSGAVRIDHAMSLFRLFWIAEGFGAAGGLYVRYPFHAMLRTLAGVSEARKTIIIGEDLGVVPEGFRPAMQKSEIQGYRVFFFEKAGDEFYFEPQVYPREALACVSIHDLHTLPGWWSGHDIAVREKMGLIADTELPNARAHRAHQRRRALGLLKAHKLMPESLEPVLLSAADAPEEMPHDLVVAFHRLVARAPSRLFVAQAEDLTRSRDQVNIPGTTWEHPNWRRRLPVGVNELADHPLFRAVTAALREERPRDA